MDFKVELSNVDYSDKKLISALENISEDVSYMVEITYDEAHDVIEKYLMDKLDIDLDASNMHINTRDKKLYYDDIFEASIITNIMINHFGISAITPGGSGVLRDYYNIDVNVILRKIVKLGYTDEIDVGYNFSFDYADDLMESWVYKYLTNKGEVE